MAKIRAYKLAEELKLDRDDFVKRAAELGVQLRSPMVGIEEDQADFLRRKLGMNVQKTEEQRLKSGAVIRRRRRVVAPKPPQEPTPPVEPELSVLEAEAAAAAPEPLAVEAAAAAEAAEAPEAPETLPAPGEPAPVEPEPIAAAKEDEPEEAAPEEIDEESLPEIEVEPGPATVTRRPTVSPPREGGATVVAPPSFEGPSPAVPTGAGASKRPVRRTATQEMNLREQDSMARTMLGNVQRRLEQRRLIVERQSRLSPGRRVRAGVAPRSRAAQRRGTPRVKIPAEASFKEIARQSGIKIRDLWRRARAAGVECDRDDKIDFETAALIGSELGFEVEQIKSEIEAVEEKISARTTAPEGDLKPRPPVVTVMGHVDHGKTSLLDYIRKTNVVAGESGGITQHIGAYTVSSGDGSITFIDTPGHAAFTQMRARGAQVTDIVVLVVAADDGVMPQTIEAIDHARAAEVPLIVAVNKIDRPEANPQRVKQALLEHKVVVEEFGGDTIAVEVSATQGTGIEKLLEMLSLQAEILELRARARGPARGWVVEARLDRGRGPVATVLIKEGVLQRGDAVVIGNVYGRVRVMTDHQGKQVKQAGPSTPVQLVGLAGVPDAGDELIVAKNEREAKALAEHRVSEQRRAAAESAEAPMTDIFSSIGEEEAKDLRIVLKTDVHGTMEAIREGLERLSTDRVSVKIIHTGVGGIGESDVMLAAASSAVVIGFHVRPEPAARKAAERERVDVRSFEIVYELFDEVKGLMQGLLPPKLVEEVSGHAEVRELFVVPRVGTIAGCQVAEGMVRRANSIRVVRNGVPIYTGRVASLRRFKDDVREVSAPFECGIRIENFNDVKVGDILESFQIEERADSL